MVRCLLFALLVVSAWTLLGDDAAWAQDNTWPAFPLDPTNPNAIPRGPGGYFSWIKLALMIALYLLWIRTSDWANKDCQILGMPYATWNPIIVGTFVVCLIAALTIPSFLLGYSVLVIGYAAPLLTYVAQRNAKVDPHERVLTPNHIRHLIGQGLQKMGMDVATEAKEAHEKGTPVTFLALGGSEKQNQSNIITARQSPGYMSAKDLVAELIKQRADKCMLDFTRDAVTVRYQIDGVWHESEGQDRESGDNMLSVFKRMSNLNVEERRKRQSGRFAAEYEKRKYMGLLVSQGTQTGERVILQLERPHADFKTLADLGMRDKMEERLKQIMQNEKGMIIFSSPPAGGLSTTVRLALRLLDRFMREFAAVQEVKSPEPVAENIEITNYNLAEGETPQRVLESLLRREPNGIVIHELPNLETAQMLCEHASKDKLVITTVRAKEAVEALLRVLLLKVPASKFAPVILAVVNQRLIRKLCEECKEAYDPAPQLLQKLGIPAGRIEKLYRTPEPNNQDKVCQHCNGIGYFGQTSIFELLVIDKSIRDALEKQPKLEILRQVARQAGNRNLQQEGIVLVAQGITSVQELSRVLKQ